MTMRTPCVSTMAEVRRRSSRRSDEVQTRQRHPMTGTPCEVPVPRKVSFMQTKIVKIWRLRTRAGKILRTDFRIRRKTGYEKNGASRRGGASAGKSRRSVSRRKADGASAREKQAERRQGKAGKQSAEKSRRSVSGKSERSVSQRKEAERRPKKSGQTVGTETGSGSEKSRRMFPAAFQHFRTAGGTPGDQ